jgi:hypothetical protein
MSKVVSKKRNSVDKADLINQFKGIDTRDFPDFHSYHRVLDMGLWVLWVVKEKLGIRKLTANQVASVMMDVKEVSIQPSSVAQSFKRAGQKVHIYHEKGETLYEIMKAGKEHLLNQMAEGAVEVFYFEPGQKYSSKRLLTKNILGGLSGELKIVDPYCGERTLDCLRDIKGNIVKFLTRAENLPQKERDHFLRELQDFKSENPSMEFRSCPNTDLHDRYIVSPNSLVLLGHSIKDLGGKESFAIVLSEESCKNVLEALNENFDRRWKQSTNI